jgi:hypothetical protein
MRGVFARGNREYSHIPQFRKRKNRIANTQAKQMKNLLMKSSQSQHLGLGAGTNADVQEINALKTVENPAHGGAVGRFVDLIGKGLFRCHQLATQQMLGQPIHQQAEHHHETQSNHALWLLDEHGGSQKQGISEKTKPTLHPSLLF